MTLVALGGGPGMLKSSLESRAWSAVAANIYSFYSELMHDFTSERHKVFAQISWVKCLCLWAIKLSCKEITKKKKSPQVIIFLSGLTSSGSLETHQSLLILVK